MVGSSWQAFWKYQSSDIRLAGVYVGSSRNRNRNFSKPRNVWSIIASSHHHNCPLSRYQFLDSMPSFSTKCMPWVFTPIWKFYDVGRSFGASWTNHESLWVKNPYSDGSLHSFLSWMAWLLGFRFLHKGYIFHHEVSRLLDVLGA